MASSLFSNAQHIDFDSVLAMDDPGMVSMFEALEASGLRGFLGCPAVVYEDALVDFFENASVRNGVVFSTVGGQIVKISEKLFAETFEMPIEGLGDLSEMPKDAIFDARSIVSLSGEQINLSGRKNQMKMPYRLLCDIVAKAISVKAGSFNAITVEKFSLMTAMVCGVKMNWAKFLFVPVEKNWFDLPYEDIVKRWEDENPVVTASDTEDEDVATADVATADEVKQEEEFEAPISAEVVLDADEQRSLEDILLEIPAENPVVTASDTEDEDVATADVATADEVKQEEEFEAPISAEVVLDADEQRSLEDILLEIPVDIPLPSSCMEVTQIKMGQMIKIPGVTKWTWFLKQLPSIPADDKGKELLVEKDPVRGNPAKEHFSLICADIDFLDQVLRWGETESPQEAIRRKFYILLKYRTILVWKFLDAWRINFAPGQGSSAVDIHVIELLTELYLSLLEELANEVRILGLTWTKSCCSKIFEGYPGDRGAVIARTNTTTRSLCWIRRKFLVNGVWAVEQCADMWVKIPRKVVSTEVLRQRQFDDTLPSMSAFFKLLRKRWADVCLEAVEFCVQRLFPVGSSQFCRFLQIVESVSSFAPGSSSVFALRFSPFCSVFVDLSLLNRISSADISEFLSAIVLEKTVLRGVQSFEDSFAVAPSVQLALEQQQTSSSSSSSSLRFDKTDIHATASSQPTSFPDFSATLADFQATLSEQLFESQTNISSKLHKIEQSVRDSLNDQAAVFKSLNQETRQENRTLNDVHTIHFNEFRKQVLAQNASIFVGLADVRKEVQDVNAKPPPPPYTRHLLHAPSDLPAPATLAGALLVGPPPGLSGANGPSNGPNQGPRWENGGWNRAACARRQHGAPPLVGPCFQSMARHQGPPTDLPRFPIDCLNTSPRPQEQPQTESMHKNNQNREM
ncbi:hypothetical protein F511_37628 [Dorcoceras hygrometricum]|uniref:Dystroglycan-like n=1 Tax=Dorcoceras hygrometricum TaxID=472368 RepID=A0A2Z7B1J1_9LAMI|nr:hypothetical protein F511_37628 [Dorcoceras hygrometricum]